MYHITYTEQDLLKLIHKKGLCLSLRLSFVQVLDVLVEKVQNSETDDIAVLLLGYDEQMQKMLRNQNPGFTTSLLITN